MKVQNKCEAGDKRTKLDQGDMKKIWKEILEGCSTGTVVKRWDVDLQPGLRGKRVGKERGEGCGEHQASLPSSESSHHLSAISTPGRFQPHQYARALTLWA